MINIGQRGTCYIDATAVQRTFTFKVATPALASLALAGNQIQITATCATVGATMRYTTDGSDPTVSSTIYSAPLTLNNTAAFKIRGFLTDYVDSDVAGRLVPPSFSIAGGTFFNDQSVTITAPSGASLKILQSNRNYLDSSTWILGTQGNQPGFAANGTTAAENQIETGLNPYGSSTTLWAAYNMDTFSGEPGQDGGWNSTSFAVDRTKSYRFSVWIKKTGGASGSTYFGCGWDTVSSLTGSASETVNGNPYFWSGTLPLNEWHLLVGYIHPAGDTTTTHYGKVYKSDGTVAFNGTDFKWLNTTTTTQQRAYLYYSTDTNVRQYFWNPKVEEVSSYTGTPDVLFATPVSSPQTITVSGNSGNVIQAVSYSATPSPLYSTIVSQTYLSQFTVSIGRPPTNAVIP